MQTQGVDVGALLRRVAPMWLAWVLLAVPALWMVVSYTGALWRNGEVFDSSFNRSGTFTFKVGAKEVISGWDKGVAGATIGSRLLLIVPPSEGYGEEGSGDIKGTDTIVFVVDVLGAY